jgi:hypothetical protein
MYPGRPNWEEYRLINLIIGILIAVVTIAVSAAAGCLERR